MTITADILERRKTHFVLWCLRGAGGAAGAAIGELFSRAMLPLSFGIDSLNFAPGGWRSHGPLRARGKRMRLVGRRRVSLMERGRRQPPRRARGQSDPGHGSVRELSRLAGVRAAQPEFYAAGSGREVRRARSAGRVRSRR